MEDYDAFDVTAGGVSSKLIVIMARFSSTLSRSAPPAVKKPYEISYKVKAVEVLQAEQQKLVDSVAGMLECDVSSTIPVCSAPLSA